MLITIHGVMELYQVKDYFMENGNAALALFVVEHSQKRSAFDQTTSPHSGWMTIQNKQFIIKQVTATSPLSIPLYLLISNLPEGASLVYDTDLKSTFHDYLVKKGQQTQ